MEGARKCSALTSLYKLGTTHMEYIQVYAFAHCMLFDLGVLRWAASLNLRARGSTCWALRA